MTAEDIRAGKTNFTDKGYDTDWLDAVSRTGFTHNHNFNITGGSKQTTYSADVTYRKEDGVIMNTYSEDIRMRFDVSHWMLNDMLKVNLNMVKKWHKNSATNATATDQSNIYRQAIMRNPTAPIYNEDGSYNEDFNVNYYYNPVGMLEERLGNYTYEETRATGNVTFEPVKGWQTNLMVATSRFNAHDKGYNTTDYFSNQLNEWTGYAVNAIHKVVGIDDTRTDYQGYDYPPPGQGEQSPLIKHQGHGREMKKQSCHLPGGFYIVHEADERHQCQGKQEPGIFKVTRQEIGQRSEIEYNPTTP